MDDKRACCQQSTKTSACMGGNANNLAKGVNGALYKSAELYSLLMLCSHTSLPPADIPLRAIYGLIRLQIGQFKKA